MTAYIPFLTLPEYLYSNPVVAVLFPLVLGMGVGFTVGSMLIGLLIDRPSPMTESAGEQRIAFSVVIRP